MALGGDRCTPVELRATQIPITLENSPPNPGERAGTGSPRRFAALATERRRPMFGAARAAVADQGGAPSRATYLRRPRTHQVILLDVPPVTVDRMRLTADRGRRRGSGSDGTTNVRNGAEVPAPLNHRRATITYDLAARASGSSLGPASPTPGDRPGARTRCSGPRTRRCARPPATSVPPRVAALVPPRARAPGRSAPARRTWCHRRRGPRGTTAARPRRRAAFPGPGRWRSRRRLPGPRCPCRLSRRASGARGPRSVADVAAPRRRRSSRQARPDLVDLLAGRRLLLGHERASCVGHEGGRCVRELGPFLGDEPGDLIVLDAVLAAHVLGPAVDVGVVRPLVLGDLPQRVVARTGGIDRR